MLLLPSLQSSPPPDGRRKSRQKLHCIAEQRGISSLLFVQSRELATTPTQPDTNRDTDDSGLPDRALIRSARDSTENLFTQVRKSPSSKREQERTRRLLSGICSTKELVCGGQTSERERSFKALSDWRKSSAGNNKRQAK